MDNNTGRILYLDFLKCFAIFSVLLGHSVQYLSKSCFVDNPIWSIIYSYHMPLFMFICGYFSVNSINSSFINMTKKKVIGIGMPIITAFIMATIKNFFISTDIFSDITNSFFHLLWFLKCLLLCYLIVFIFIRLSSNIWIAAITSILIVSITPKMGVVYFNFMLPFFWVGYLYKTYENLFLNYKKFILIICTILYISMLFGWNGRMTIYFTPIKFWNWSNYTLDYNNLTITIYRFIIGLSGSLMFFLFAQSFWERIRNANIANSITNIGKSTLGIYWFQVFTLEIIFSKLNIDISQSQTNLFAPLLAGAELILCFNLVTMTRHFKIPRFCILGETAK